MKKRFYSVLILFCCSVFHLSAQTYNWSASIGGSKTTPIPTADEIRDIATDAAGNVYVVGYYTANMTMPVAPLTATNGGLQDIFLAKYNSAGVMQWYQKAGVAQGDKGLSIAVNSAGEVYMAGSFQGSVFFKFAVGFNLVSNGANPDMVLAKYSAAGVLDWARGVGSTGPDEAVAVALDPAENPYIAGYISSTSVTNVYITGNFPAPNLGTLNGVGGLDVAVIRFTPAGGYTSSNVYGSVAGSEKPTAMKIDASGEMYLAGVFFNTVDFDPIGITNISESAPQGSGDAFIAKYTAAGALAWVGSLRGVASEFVNDLSVDGSGNLIAVGSFTGFENFDLLGGTQTLTSSGLKDIFIAKYDAATGIYISARQIGGAGDDEAYGVHVFSSGDFYVTGSFTGASIDFDPSAGTNNLTSAGTTDAFLAKYTTAIANTTALNIGAAAADVSYAVNYTSDGKIVWAGSYSSAIDVDPGVPVVTLTSLGAEDMFLLSYNESCIAPSITTQPTATQTLCTGNAAAFSVVAAGTSLTYQWKLGATSLTNGGTISGATSANLAISSLVPGDAGNYTCEISGVCGGPVTTNISALTVNSGASITTQPVATQTLCVGAAAGFSVVATGTSLTYQWKKGVTSLTNGGNISGATSANLAISSLVAGDAGNYTCDVTASGCGAAVTTTVSALTVNTAVAITTQPVVSQTLCTGNAASISVVATGTGLTYQWKLGATSLTNGGTISGATSANLAISSLIAGDAGNYTCVISGSCGAPVTSNISVLNINNSISITTQPAATQTLCTGNAAAFSVVASGSGLTYQWKLGATSLTNGGTISGATSANLAISSLVAGDAGNYTCVVSGSCGAPVTSAISALTVNTSIAITTQPVATQTLCAGTAAAFSVVATGSGLMYQWKLGVTSLTNVGTISGATSANLAISSLVAGDAGNYTCVVSGSCGAPLTSSISALTVNTPVAITTQPVVTQTLCTGTAAAMSVVATGSGLTYQWKLGAVSLVNGGAISGATSANLAISSLVAGDAGNYTCVISGSCGSPVTSNVSALIVNTSIAIATQPVATQTLCAGTAAAFSIVATGTGLTYQWKLGAVSLTNAGTISGVTSANLAISSLVAGDAGNYTCVISGTCGAPITSSISALIVNTPVAITTQPVAGQTLCTGNAAAFSVVATGSGLTYQWELGAVSLVNGGTLSGATTANLAISSLVAGDAGNYTCVISGLCGAPVTSGISALTVNTGASITTNPVATQTLCASNAAAFNVVATGSGLTYQWKLGAVSLVDGGTISGANSANLAISSLVAGDAGNYTCSVTASGCGVPVVTSISALIVNTPVVITTQPIATQTLCTGSAAAFSVVATGSGLTYQWKLGAVSLVDGGTLSGATTANLAISSLVVGDASNYTCEISGSCGAPVTSTVSTLIVNTPVAITTQPVATQTLCTGTAAAFSAVVTGSGLTYQWNLAATALVDGGTISGATSANLAISSLVAGDAGNYTCVITGSCGAPVTSSVSALIVNMPIAITTQPLAGQTLCTGNAASFNVVATGSGLSYQWELGAVALVDGGTISGTTTSTLAISSLIAGDAGNYTCVISGSCGAPVTSSISALTVNTGSSITTQPVATQTLCTGTAASFSVVASGSSLTYQWKLGAVALVDGGTISGAMTANLAISSLVAGDAGNYTCDVTASGCGAPTTTSISALTVNSSASITTQPVATQTLCTGNAAAFNVVAAGSGLTYQWKLGAIALVDGGTISGATTSTLNISSLVAGDAGNYTCDIADLCGTPVTSAISALTVNTGSSITTQPVATQTLCTGTAAGFSVVAAGSSLTYQWKLGAVALVDGGTISGATTANLAISSSVAGDAGNYTCDVTASGCGAPTTTTVSALIVNSFANITTQPVATQTLCAGSGATISVIASGSGLTYQWKLGGSTLVNGGTIAGATTATLSISSLIAGDAGNYTCVISDLCATPVTSAVSALVVSSGSALITTQPTNIIACAGLPATFDLIASGVGLTYQWKKNGVSLVDGGNVTGATTSSLVLIATTLADAATYTCVIASTCGAPITSSSAVLTVGASTVVVTKQPISSVICLNQQASFSVIATGGISYQWQYKPTGGAYADIANAGSVSGATTAVLVINNAQFINRGNYRCVIGSSACAGGLPSAAASLSFESPMIISEPLSQSLCNNQTVTFGLVALGNNLSYQWMKDGAILSNSTKVSGATTPNLRISNVDVSDAANYYCIVQGLCPPPALSDVVSLFVSFCTDVEEANQTNVFTVYPNPSEGQFNIEMRKFTASNLQYDVFNTLGENVFSSSLEGGGDVTSTIDLGEQASGVYLLRVRYGDQQVWERLVLEK